MPIFLQGSGESADELEEVSIIEALNGDLQSHGEDGDGEGASGSLLHFYCEYFNSETWSLDYPGALRK